MSICTDQQRKKSDTCVDLSIQMKVNKSLMCRSFAASWMIWVHLGNRIFAFSPPSISNAHVYSSRRRGISIKGATESTVCTSTSTNRIHGMRKVSSSSLYLLPMSIHHRTVIPTSRSESAHAGNNNARYQASTARDDDGDASFSNQTTLTKWYQSASMLYFSHIVVSLINSGSSPLRCLYDIGGSIMCTGVMMLLRKASQQSQIDDTWKRLNGLMVLHSSLVLGLGLMASYFQFGIYGPGSEFGYASYLYWGTLLAAAGTSGYVAVKGYLQSMTNTLEFLKETDRLLGEANQLITKLPNSLSSLGPVVTLWTIAALKASLMWSVAQAISQKALINKLPLQTVAFTNLRHFCRLTILGGSLVSANSKKVTKEVSSTLHFLSSYVLGTMAGEYKISV